MNKKLDIIYIKIHELIVFLKEYVDYPNVKYFLNILRDMEMTILHYMNTEMSNDVMINLRHMYKSMFFPRDGLGDFYIMDSNRAIMQDKNSYFSDLIRELDRLLK